ncbi:Gfo/Idh/MocA family oxidoreductase [uncultured Pseudokineococcus sp.]|uniref:Gfo/Idh/MocA family protein n=1 Tax=uncultured Pseudokineococcus sp. TaxID=1642928 RepID=UPI00344874F6
MVGHSFMGAAHSRAWTSAAASFPVPLLPRLAALAGRDGTRAAEAAQRLGWADVETDWRALLEREDVDLVDICSPGDTHAEIACAALAAGKHVLCEKPLANSVEEAEAMVAVAEEASARGVRSMVGFTYRRVPALELARQLVASGRLGALRHVRVAYLQDWLVDADAPMSWRLDKQRAGSGALGDIGAHAVDIAQHVTGQRLTGVTGLLETFVRERPVVDGPSGLTGGTGARGATAPVTVDDAAVFLARTDGGALATFEASRTATGHKNALRLEVDGELGSVVFDLERLNELQVHERGGDALVEGRRRVVVTEPGHPWMSGWWPPGHVLGWEHAFTHQAVDLLGDLAAGRAPSPSFREGLVVQRVLDAVERSAAAGGRWVEVPAPAQDAAPRRAAG